MLFKMMLLGHLYGVTSERTLAEECTLNLAFMWYLGYDPDEAIPDHSVIPRARSRYGKKTFERIAPAIPPRSSHTQRLRPGHLPVSAFRYDAVHNLKRLLHPNASLGVRVIVQIPTR